MHEPHLALVVHFDEDRVQPQLGAGRQLVGHLTAGAFIIGQRPDHLRPTTSLLDQLAHHLQVLSDVLLLLLLLLLLAVVVRIQLRAGQVPGALQLEDVLLTPDIQTAGVALR